MSVETQAWAKVIREREPVIGAFTWIDLDRAQRLTATAPAGPLHGLWVGIKDIVDTAGIPTERGSALFRGRVPERSAIVVERIEAAGGVTAGKTVTAELASFTPGRTTNPWDPSRTPGGSSMGSAAAVAAGMLPLAIGTQTAGSVIRPAAFCGVVGYKPTAGLIPRDGVMILSDTLDQLGSFATSVAAAAELCSVMSATELVPEAPTGAPRFALYRSPEWEDLEPAARERLERDVERIRAAGAAVEEPVPVKDFDGAFSVQRRLMVYEMARNLGAEVARAPELVSEHFRRTVANGQNTSDNEYRAALEARERLVEAAAAWLQPFDAVLTPPALGEAPGLETTGDPRPCARWTLIGAPAITLPTGRGPHGLPLGIQLCAAPGSDARLLGAAQWVERTLGASSSS